MRGSLGWLPNLLTLRWFVRWLLPDTVKVERAPHDDDDDDDDDFDDFDDDDFDDDDFDDDDFDDDDFDDDGFDDDGFDEMIAMDDELLF